VEAAGVAWSLGRRKEGRQNGKHQRRSLYRSEELVNVSSDSDPEQRSFGRHVRRLRNVRRLTQERLAERSGLTSDTIRRLERGEFSPSVRTLRKLCKGLGLSVAQLFQGFELAGNRDEISELAELLRGRGRATISRITELVRVILQALDEWRAGDANQH
jgi:transcriptional regulator with XRE-family HTH domain